MAPPPFSPLRRLFLPHRRLLSAASARAAAADPTYKSIRNLSYEDPALALDFFRRSVASGHLPGRSVYNLMLRNLARPSSAQAHFWPFLRDMEAAGHSIDPRTSTTVLSYFRNAGRTADYASLMAHFAKAKAKGGNPVFAAAAAVRGLDLRYSKAKAEELAKSLEGLNLLPLKEQAVCKVLREVKDCPAEAMEFFLWAGRQDGYKHGSDAYNTMARVLGSSYPWKLRELIQEMKAKGMDLEIDTYRCVFKQLKGKSDMLAEVVQLYELMMDGPCKPSQKDGLVLLKRVLQGAKPDLVLAYRVVSKFGAVWKDKTKDLFDAIYRALTINGMFDEAADLVEKMKGEGHQPDNITYSNLVYGLCKANRCDEARKVFDEMEAKGCTPDLQTWTLLIQGHFEAGEVDKALQYLTEMNEKNLEADANLLDVMVKGLCSQDKAGAAHSCFVEMVDKGKFKRPWRCTYKLLIGELLRLKKLEDALGLLKSMKAHSYLGCTYSFPSLIAENGTIEDAREFLKVLRTPPSQTPPTYLMLFKAFFDKGRYSDAQDLLSECPVDIGKDQDITMLFESVKSESTA